MRPEDACMPMHQAPAILRTPRVEVAPEVLIEFLYGAALHPHNEVGALLLGHQTTTGLVVDGLAWAQRVGTAVNITFTPTDFERASQAAKEGQCIVGWAHSHPTYGAFLSPTDVRFQTQGQGLFDGFVALVADPFHERGFDFSFYQVHDGQAVRARHHIGGERVASSPD